MNRNILYIIQPLNLLHLTQTQLFHTTLSLIQWDHWISRRSLGVDVGRIFMRDAEDSRCKLRFINHSKTDYHCKIVKIKNDGIYRPLMVTTKLVMTKFCNAGFKDCRGRQRHVKQVHHCKFWQAEFKDLYTVFAATIKAVNLHIFGQTGRTLRIRIYIFYIFYLCSSTSTTMKMATGSFLSSNDQHFLQEEIVINTLMCQCNPGHKSLGIATWSILHHFQS